MPSVETPPSPSDDERSVEAETAEAGSSGTQSPKPNQLRWVLMVASVGVAAAIAFVPNGLHRIEGYGNRPAYAAAVTALMALWWLTEALPIAVTACLPVLLFPLLGVFGKGFWGDTTRSIEPFADGYIFLFLGGMAIGAAMEQWNLHRRVALYIMRAIGTDPKRLLLGMLVATSVVSLWISNTATAVMMLPIGLALLAQLERAHGGRRLHHFGTAIMLSVAYACNVGGIGTKIGTGTNSIFCGFVAEKLHYDIGFLHYIGAALPFVLLFIPVVWLVLWQKGRKDNLGQGQARDVLDSELKAMGPMQRGEKKVAIVFLCAATFWIIGDPIRQLIAPYVPILWKGFKFQAKHYEASVAMIAASSLVAWRGLSFASIRKIPYGTLVLLGGSFAMAAGIEGSGLSGWMAQQFHAITHLPLLAQIGVATLGTVGLSAVASNTATINVVLNVLPPQLGVLFATNLAASCDFMLPAGTPPNAIVFGSGYIRLPTMIKTGFVLDLTATVMITGYVYLYARHLFP